MKIRGSEAGTGVACTKCGGCAKETRDSRGAIIDGNQKATIRTRRCSNCGENVRTIEMSVAAYKSTMPGQDRIDHLTNQIMKILWDNSV